MKWRRISNSACAIVAIFLTTNWRCASAQSPTKNNDIQSLEVRWARTGQPMVRPLVNGVDLGWFILDTGAGMLAIAPTAAVKVGLQDAEDIEVVGVGGRAHKKIVVGNSLVLGGVSIRSPRFVTLEELDNPLARFALGAPVVGVLGFDIFERAVVEIDKPNNRVALHTSAPTTIPETAWTTLRIANRLPIVTAAFESNAGEFVLDTGANSAVTIFADAVERLKLLEGRETKRSLRLGVGGGKSQVRGKLEWLQLAGTRFEPIVTDFSTQSDKDGHPKSTIGVIGMGALGERRAIFDYAKGRFALISRTDK